MPLASMWRMKSQRQHLMWGDKVEEIAADQQWDDIGFEERDKRGNKEK